MASNKMAKYRVDAPAPGLQLTGAGEIFGGQSILPPGSIMTVSADFDPRACMTPMNEPAVAAFARKRKKVEAAWRDSLAKGLDPDGNGIESLADGRTLTKEEIEVWVKRAVARVGPTARAAQREKAKRPRIDPSTLRISAAAPPPKPADEDDDMLPAGAAGGDAASGRASDQS